MSKKKKRKEETEQPPVSAKLPVVGISRRGKMVIAAGILILIVGFFLLTKTDPSGQNWASLLSPFVIIGAYVIIGIGIVLPEKFWWEGENGNPQ